MLRSLNFVDKCLVNIFILSQNMYVILTRSLIGDILHVADSTVDIISSNDVE